MIKIPNKTWKNSWITSICTIKPQKPIHIATSIAITFTKYAPRLYSSNYNCSCELKIKLSKTLISSSLPWLQVTWATHLLWKKNAMIIFNLCQVREKSLASETNSSSKFIRKGLSIRKICGPELYQSSNNLVLS